MTTLTAPADTGSLIVGVPLTGFLDSLPFHPYENPPWCDCPALSRSEVLSCAQPDPGRRDWGGGLEGRATHTARVAHLVRTWANDGSDAPDVEVFRGVIVHDGWHRIAAAIARADDLIHIELAGDLTEAADWGFPVAHLLAA